MSKICQKCNEDNINEANFCRICGTELFEEQNSKADSCFNQKKVKKQYKNIGGWLILVALGLIFSHFFLLADFIKLNSTNIKDNFTYLYMIEDYTQINKHSLLIYLDALLLFITTLTTLHFFSKTKSAKKLLIICYICSIILGLVSMGILNSMDIKQSNSEITKTLIQMFIFLIWILYFFLSKRVKETFVLEQTKLAHFVKIIISLILPLIIIFTYFNMLNEQKYVAYKIKQTKKENQIKEKKEMLTLNFYRELFESESEFIKILKNRKQSIIDSQVSSFIKNFTIKNKFIRTEEDILNYVDMNFPYPNFVKGILYFCGKERSNLNQNLYISYNYLTKSEKDIENKSLMILAEMNLYGIGTSQNIEKAVSLAANSNVKNDFFKSMKYNYLGNGYLLGKYYKKDIHKAIIYYKKSANLNDSISAYLTALLMATEKSKYNKKEIIKFFNISKKLGNPLSDIILALYYNENNEKAKAKSILSNCYYLNKNCAYYYEQLFGEITSKNNTQKNIKINK